MPTSEREYVHDSLIVWNVQNPSLKSFRTQSNWVDFDYILFCVKWVLVFLHLRMVKSLIVQSPLWKTEVMRLL